MKHHETHRTHRPILVGPTPADILRGAALYLSRHGWTQGVLYTDPSALTPPACAIGAIAIATYGHAVEEPDNPILPEWEDYQRAYRYFATYLWRLYEPHPHPVHGYGLWSVGDWNDEPDQTSTEVITALNEAAADWDYTHNPNDGRPTTHHPPERTDR